MLMDLGSIWKAVDDGDPPYRHGFLKAAARTGGDPEVQLSLGCMARRNAEGREAFRSEGPEWGLRLPRGC